MNSSILFRLTGLLVLQALSTPVQAQALHAVRPLAGYKCMSLSLTDSELMNPHITIPIRAQPTDGSPVSSIAASIVFVAEPEDLSNGYLRVIQLGGRTGWIKKDDVTEWHLPNGKTNATCIPSMMSDGRLGFDVKHNR